MSTSYKATSFTAVAAIVGLGVAVVGSTGTADAKRWKTIEHCYGAVEAAATGQGILGKGSQRARSEAQLNWEDEVGRQYGSEYARLRYAKDVQWDCKRGAVIRAKCVVVAKPCAARIRG